MLQSANANADRAFFREALALHAIDADGGWLVFAVPSTELSIHPGDGLGPIEFSLTVADVATFAADMARRGVGVTPVNDEGWGLGAGDACDAAGRQAADGLRAAACARAMGALAGAALRR